MARRRHPWPPLTALALCAGLWAARAAETAAPLPTAAVRPGEEFLLHWDPVGRDLPVYVPSDYAADRRWPVVLFYHGLNGEPTTGLMRGLTRGRGAIVVGMEYIERGLVQRSAEQQQAYQAKEQAQLEELLRVLPERVRLDRRRVYLAGVSKGGWQVSAFAESAQPRVAGYMILLAGRLPRARSERPDLSEQAVYVGTGEMDEGNVYARMAVQYYERCGAAVTWEEYAGRGHEVDAVAPRLGAWVTMRLLTAGDERRHDAEEWVRRGLAKAKETDRAQACYAALERLAGDPRAAFCGVELRQQLAVRLERLRMVPDVQPAWQARHVYERALWQEQTATRLDDVEAALTLYRQAEKRYPDTEYGRLAAREVERLKETVEQMQSRTRPRAPALPRLRHERH